MCCPCVVRYSFSRLRGIKVAELVRLWRVAFTFGYKLIDHGFQIGAHRIGSIPGDVVRDAGALKARYKASGLFML